MFFLRRENGCNPLLRRKEVKQTEGTHQRLCCALVLEMENDICL
jgi:hypothetical protein